MTADTDTMPALPGHLPTSTEDEASILARLSKTPAEAYERGYMDGHARAIESTAAEIARLQAECEALRKDAESWRAVDSHGRYWLTIRAKVIDALAREGFTIVTTQHGVHLMRLGKAEANTALSTSTAPSDAEE